MIMSTDQCRAARGLLGWSAEELAIAAKIGVATVRRFELGEQVRASSVTAMVAAFQTAGLAFISAGERGSIGGEGVRLK